MISPTGFFPRADFEWRWPKLGHFGTAWYVWHRQTSTFDVHEHFGLGEEPKN